MLSQGGGCAWLRLLLSIASGGLMLFFWFCLPEPLFDEPWSTVVLDRKGKLLSAHIAADEQWRFPELEQVPPKFAAALVQFEDKRFYRHPGVDPLALLRALSQNLRQGRVVSGGSTLSMQVIRLARRNPPRTVSEKLLELIRALRLETRYGKGQILALYASHAPFGGNVVGLEAAAWRYFGRDPAHLSWAESSLLAVLPNNPALLHPGRNHPQLRDKRDRLLERLHAQGLLSQLDYRLALAEPLPGKPQALARLAPHLLDTLTVRTPRQGQRWRTTLDGQLQRQVSRVAQRTGEQLVLEGIHNLAVVVLDNHSFGTLAYVGNLPTGDASARGHAIDMVQRGRSTGSILKPLLFATMVEQGQILPGTLVADVPVHYAGFSPQNYSREYHGAVPARTVLVRSLNIPAVNMLSRHGVEPFVAFLKQMGMTGLHRPAREYGLPLILGGAEGSLWELTALYANLADRANQGRGSNQSVWRQPVLLQGEHTNSRRPATLSTASAWMTLQALLDVARPGEDGYWEKFSSSRKVAWKTGTSYGHRDAWAVGATPDYTVGVWVGNADGESRPNMTGTRSAAPLLFNVLNLLPAGSVWFERPDWQMKTVQVCADDGFLANGRCQTRSELVPLSSHFGRISPYHRTVHLDESGQWRVTSECEAVGRMQVRDWLVLPPDQEFYYRQSHAQYQPLPPLRPDCRQVEAYGDGAAITLLYPQDNTQIYIPRELGGGRSETVFRAVPRSPEALLYWHLDNEFLGTTQMFHEMAVRVGAGSHRVAVVDEAGNWAHGRFQVFEGRK